MSPEEINDLKKQVDILSLCGMLAIKVKKTGKSYMARCPFADHEDKNPSFSVDPMKGLYHCFGCGKKGDQISLVRELKGYSFQEAVSFLDERFNFSRLTKETVNKESEDIKVYSEEERQTLLRKVFEHYHWSFKNSDRAINYLKKRGIYSKSLVDELKIGYANKSVYSILTVEEKELAVAVGILSQTKNKYEIFNGSVVFPILDENANILGVYGRKILDRQREGSPLHLYLKGNHKGVFNKKAFMNQDLIICESIIDAMTFLANGIMNVTASYGTNGFTRHHIDLLKNSSVKTVYIAYDNDQGGDNGTKRLVETINLINKDILIKRVVLPGGSDINDYALSVSEDHRAVLLDQLLQDSIILYMPAEEKKHEDVIQTDKEVIIQRKKRSYRIRGIDKSNSLEHLKVNLKVSQEDKFHLDVLNLFSAKQRIAYVKQAAIVLEVDSSTLFQDMAFVLEQAEILNDKQLAGNLGDQQIEYKMSVEEEKIAMSFLENQELIKEILADFIKMGFVGEEINKIVIYLCAVSRMLDDPLSVFIVSRSAAGKSCLQDAILRFIPPEFQVKYTAMTGQSLFYMAEDSLKHKVLAISEHAGASGASYALKTLNSEGELKIASTGKDPLSGKMKTFEYHVKGPVAIISTTTDVEMDEELANRCITLTVDEDSSQTAKIHRQQRFEQTLEGFLLKNQRQDIALKHQNAMRLLRPLKVFNPFARQLTFIDNRLRTRRDHMKYLRLINAITFLFQYQREVKHSNGIEYIETTVDDIVLANKLAKVVLSKSLDDLAPPSGKLLAIMSQMIQNREKELEDSEEEITVSRKEICDYSKWSHWQVKKHIKQLEDLGFIHSKKTKKGQRFEYEVLYSGNEDFDIGLIDPELLKNECADSESDRIGLKLVRLPDVVSG